MHTEQNSVSLILASASPRRKELLAQLGKKREQVLRPQPPGMSASLSAPIRLLCWVKRFWVSRLISKMR